MALRIESGIQCAQHAGAPAVVIGQLRLPARENRGRDRREPRGDRQPRHASRYGAPLHCALAVDTVADVAVIAEYRPPCAIAYSSRLRAIVCALGG